MELKDQVRDYWEQGSCGTNHTDKVKFTKAYFDEIEEYRYSREPFIHEFAQFSRASGKKVLEVGIGAGTDFLQWNRSGAIATGIDLTNEAIENCRNRLKLYGLDATFFQSDAENLPFEDASFDITYSWGVIHHSPNTIKALSEIYRVTKPGGNIKIMVYYRYSLYTILKWVKYGLPRFKSIDWVMARYQESPGTKVYSFNEIKKIMMGFPHDDFRIVTYNQFLNPKSKRRLARVIGSKLVNAVLQYSGFYLAFEFKKSA